MSTHPLIIFVYESFGQQFGDVLMAGYGTEPSTSPRRLYLSEVEAGAKIGWVIEFVARRCPCRDEPLVLTALLKLLLGRASISHYLEFEVSELLIELQWQDKISTRQKVEKAVNRYVRLLYDKQADTRVERPKSTIAGGGYYHLLTGYVRGVKCGSGGTLAGTLHSVCFDVSFIEGLRRGRVNFAGIDFGHLQTAE